MNSFSQEVFCTQPYEIHCKPGHKCDVTVIGNDKEKFRILTPVLQVVHSKLSGAGTMGSRYAPTLAKADFYMNLKAFDDTGHKFMKDLTTLQRSIFTKWTEYGCKHMGEAPFGSVLHGASHSENSQLLETMLSTLSPVLNASGLLKVKRKVCSFGSGEITDMPVFDGSESDLKKKSFRSAAGDVVARGDHVRAWLSFLPYSFRGRNGLSLQLCGVLKIKNREVDHSVVRGMDWTPWAVDIPENTL